jgi:hypothetical protein
VAEPARPVPRFSIGEAVTYSWNACWQNLGPVMLVSAIVLAGNGVIALLSTAFGGAAMGYAFGLFGILFNLLLVFGLLRAALTVVEGHPVALAEAFRPDGFGPFLLASVVFLLGLSVGLELPTVLALPGLLAVLLVAAALWFGVVFQFYGFVIAEHPDVGPMVALAHSAALTRGVRLRLLGLVAVLAFLNLAGLMLCFLGLVVTYALSAVALAYVYRLLSGQAIATT